MSAELNLSEASLKMRPVVQKAFVDGDGYKRVGLYISVFSPLICTLQCTDTPDEARVLLPPEVATEYAFLLQAEQWVACLFSSI